jgi:hypothetical protein
MTLVRLASLIGVALLVMVLNVAMSFLYMVVYGYLINPGHPKEYYDEHIKIAAPYCSIVAGMPLMFLAGLWVAGWGGPQGQLGVKAALVVWLAYAVIDLSIVLAAGCTSTVGKDCRILRNCCGGPPTRAGFTWRARPHSLVRRSRA